MVAFFGGVLTQRVVETLKFRGSGQVRVFGSVWWLGAIPGSRRPGELAMAPELTSSQQRLSPPAAILYSTGLPTQNH